MTEIPETIAALRFTSDNQCLFQWVEDGIERLKYIPPTAGRIAWAEADIDTGWLDQGVVRYGINRRGSWAVRFIAPVRPSVIQFADYNEENNLPASIQLMLPPLILVGIGDRYHLFATRAMDFHPDAPLAYAPFPNIYGGGRICFGTNPVPPFAEAGMRRAVQLFFESPFTASFAQDKSAAHPEDVRGALVAHARRGADTPYPLDDLVTNRFHTTIAEALDALLTVESYE